MKATILTFDKCIQVKEDWNFRILILLNAAIGDVGVQINVHKQNPPWAEGHRHVEVFVQQHGVINV